MTHDGLQVGFIQYVVLPAYQALARVLPTADLHVVQLRQNSELTYFSLALARALTLSHMLFLPLSHILSLTLSHILSHTHSLSHSLTHTLSRFLFNRAGVLVTADLHIAQLTNSLTNSPCQNSEMTIYLSLSLPPSLSISHTHTRILSLSFSLSVSLSRYLSHSLTLSISLSRARVSYLFSQLTLLSELPEVGATLG